MSTIFYNPQKEYSDRLVKFVILLSESKLDSASRLLQDFRAKNYVNHLQRLLKNLYQAELVDKQAIILKFTIKQLKSKIGNANFTNQQYKQCKSSLDVSYDAQIIRHMENNSLQSARKVAQIHKRSALQHIIQQLTEYRYLKQQTHSSKMFNKSIQLSKQARNFTKIIQDFVKLKEQINTHLTQNIKNCLADRPINLLPQGLFLSDFRHQFQKLIRAFRDMKNQVHNYKNGMQQKIENAAKQFALDWKYNKQNDLMDAFIDVIRPQLQIPKKSTNLTASTVNKTVKQNIQQMVSTNKARIFSFGKSQRVNKKNSNNQNLLIKSQQFLPLSIQEKLNEIYQVLEPQSNNQKDNFYSLTLTQKLSTILVKVKQLRDVQKNQDQTFIQNMLSLIDDNSKIPVNIVRELSDRQFSNNTNQLIQQLQVKVQRLLREVTAVTKQRDQIKKKNQNLILKLREQSANQNSSFIDQRQASQNEGQQTQKLNKQVVRLRAQLRQKYNSLKIYQEQKQHYRKQIKIQKSNYFKLEKKYKQLKQELDQQVHQIQMLHNIYQQRFLIESSSTDSNKPKLSESTVKQFKQEKDKLQKQNIALTQQNVRLQQLNKATQTVQIAIGSSQMYDGSIQQSIVIGNGSFIQSMRVQQPKVDPQTYIDKINDLQYQIQLLTLQIHQKDQANQLLNKKYLDLKNAYKQLQKQNHELSHKIDTIDIRTVTHNEHNVKNIHLFPPGFIFNQYDYQERQFLLENLISYVGPIRSTRLLYRADPFNKVNFHNYIDKHQHIVLICKTIYGKLIAGYSAQAFDAKGIQKGRGLILSLWSRKVFTVKDKKAISYDDYYIIYGNSELRVRSLQFKLFSNFGIANAYYDNGGHKVDVILGQGCERQVDLAEYQVYALDLWD